MTDFLRIVLLLALAGAVVTVAATYYAWWNEEERRLTRLMRGVLGGEPDGSIIAHGTNAAAGFRLDTEQVLVMWNGGANALLYPMSALLGAELIVDGAVVARVHRGEQRRAMDVVNPGAQEVILRLVFDNPRDPDFQLELQTTAIQEARRWIARADALIRRPVAQPVVRPAPAAEEIDEDEDDEAPF